MGTKMSGKEFCEAFEKQVIFMREHNLYPLEYARMQTNLETVTLKKYCLAGKYGFKLGGVWFLTGEEMAEIKNLPREAHKAGRPKKLNP